MQKKENKYTRSPKKDCFVSAPKNETYGQLLVKLNKALENFGGKEEILKNTNKDNADVILKMIETKNKDGKSPYIYLLQELAPKITVQNKDILLKLAQIKDSEGGLIHKFELKDLAPMITTKNKDEIIRMAELKDSEGNFVNGHLDLLNIIRAKDEIKYKINNISDPRMLDYIKKNNTKNANAKTLVKLDEVLDIYHTFNKDYSYIGIGGRENLPYNREYYNYVNKKPEVISGGKDELLDSLNASTISKDFKNEARVDRLKDYCKNNPTDEMSNYFYNEYYLKSDMVPKEVKEKCAEINEKFCTKIFLTNDHKKDFEILDYVKQELNEWKIASDGAAKTPPTLDFSAIKKDYIDSTSAYGQNNTAAYTDTYTGAISINGTDLNRAKNTLRHELTHANQTKGVDNLHEKYNLDEIMPKKLNEDGRLVLDFKNCKFKEELFNAGLPLKDVKYAYNNRDEFIAIAAEGDMSKYSPKFKQMLVDFGMPEWMFKMKPKNEVAKELFV